MYSKKTALISAKLCGANDLLVSSYNYGHCISSLIYLR